MDMLAVTHAEEIDGTLQASTSRPRNDRAPNDRTGDRTAGNARKAERGHRKERIMFMFMFVSKWSIFVFQDQTKTQIQNSSWHTLPSRAAASLSCERLAPGELSSCE